jgi:tetratricopeptide (TPR) repeat protein
MSKTLKVVSLRVIVPTILCLISLGSESCLAKPVQSRKSIEVEIQEAINEDDIKRAELLFADPRSKAIPEKQRLNLLCQASSLAGNNNKALECVNKLLTLEPTNKEHYCTRAAIYRSLGQYSKSLVDYDKVIALTNRSSSWAFYERASVYKSLGRYEDALHDFVIASRCRDSNFESTRDACYLCVKMKRHVEAIGFASSLIKQFPSDETYYVVRAKELIELGRFAEALRDLKAAETICPEDGGQINRLRIDLGRRMAQRP